jgi:hypothetical protein
MSIWDLVLLVITTEAITGIVSKSEIFYSLRKWLFGKWQWLHRLVDCPYCLSVWVAAVLTTLYYLSHVLDFYLPFKILLYGFTIHRLSNILHFCIDRIDPHKFDLEKGFDLEKEE